MTAAASVPEIAFEVDFRELPRIRRLIDLIRRNGGSVQKPLKRFNIYMVRQTAQTFAKGGRGPIEWKPLAPVTVIMRKFRKRGSGRTNPKKILQDRGSLRQSIRHEVIDREKSVAARIFSIAPHARTHQAQDINQKFSGEIKIPRRVIRPKKPGGVLVFEVDGETVFTRKVVQPAKTKKIPQRPFLFFTDKDTKKGRDLLFEHARDVVTKAAQRTKA